MTGKKKRKLTLNQRLFCEYYILGGKDEDGKFMLGNATRSYALAYGKSLKGKYNLCKSEGSNNLTKPNLLEYCKQLLRDTGFRDEVVNSRHLQIILDGKDSDSITAIKEYNQLKGRITKKVQTTDMGVKISDEELDKMLKKLDEYEEADKRRDNEVREVKASDSL